MNQALYRDLGITTEKPFFENNGSVIYGLYDMPHLLKSVRNNFKNYDVQFIEIKEGNSQRRTLQASWRDIRQFYLKDSNSKYRCAPKLTAAHVYARGLGTMKVKLAAQVFSHSVAAGLSVYVQGGLLPAALSGTAEFVGTMNSVFDSMNSKSRYSSKPYGGAVSGETKHVEFWKNAIDWVKSWKFKTAADRIVKPACQKGMIITIKSTIELWKLLQTKNLQFLLTNRLNQDCLKNTFSSVRRRGGFRDNPDCTEFCSAIHYVIVHNFIKKKKSTNCENDDAENFIKLANIKGEIAS